MKRAKRKPLERAKILALRDAKDAERISARREIADKLVAISKRLYAAPLHLNSVTVIFTTPAEAAEFQKLLHIVSRKTRAEFEQRR